MKLINCSPELNVFKARTYEQLLLNKFKKLILTLKNELLVVL